MKTYSQNDPRWKNKKLGTSNETIGESGCAITALGNLADKTPDEVNTILINGGGFIQGNLVIWERACALLGLDWNGVSNSPKKVPTVQQVTSTAIPMHFVVDLGGGMIIDSLDGKTKKNPYQIVMYKNATAKEGEAPMNEGDVINMYYELLNRSPEADALKFWTGKPMKDLFYAITNSQEYKDYHIVNSGDVVNMANKGITIKKGSPWKPTMYAATVPTPEFTAVDEQLYRKKK